MVAAGLIKSLAMTASVRWHLVLFFSSVMLMPAIADATIYKCKTQQETKWIKGTLLNNKGHFSQNLLRFDDETSILWVSFDEDSSFSPIHLKITQKHSDGNDLVAVSSTNTDGFTSENDIFRIRALGKNKDTAFLFYSSSTNFFSSGKCHIEKLSVP